MSKKQKLEFKLPRSSAKLVELVAKIHGVSARQYIANAVMSATIDDLSRLDQCLADLEVDEVKEEAAPKEEPKEEGEAAAPQEEAVPPAPRRKRKAKA